MALVNRYVRPRWLWRNTGVVTAKRWLLPRPILFVGFAIMLNRYSHTSCALTLEGRRAFHAYWKRYKALGGVIELD